MPEVIFYANTFQNRQKYPGAPHVLRCGGIVAELRNAGFDAYIVGGAVRDLCLGKLPKDYDITTNAVPAEIMKLFRTLSRSALHSVLSRWWRTP